MKFSKEIMISKVKKKTNAKVLKDIKSGDILELSIELKPVGSSRGRSYAPCIKIRKVGGDFTIKTFNEISILYEVFEFEEYN